MTEQYDAFQMESKFKQTFMLVCNTVDPKLLDEAIAASPPNEKGKFEWAVSINGIPVIMADMEKLLTGILDHHLDAMAEQRGYKSVEERALAIVRERDDSYDEMVAQLQQAQEIMNDVTKQAEHLRERSWK